MGTRTKLSNGCSSTCDPVIAFPFRENESVHDGVHEPRPDHDNHDTYITFFYIMYRYYIITSKLIRSSLTPSAPQ